MKINTVKEANLFVRGVLTSIYGVGFPNNKIPCARTYSEAYNKGKYWRYKWYLLQIREYDLIERMILYTEEVIAPRMKSLFNVCISLHYSHNGQSLILTTKPAKA